MQEKQEMQEKFNRLRKEYPRFIYRSFNWKITPSQMEAEFHFCIQDRQGCDRYHFRPWLKFPLNRFSSAEKTDPKLLDSLIFHCGMVELISYWKSCCCPHVLIECAALNPEQKAWFRKLYFYGLGEFFFLNGIRANIDDFMDIESSSQDMTPTFSALKPGELLKKGTLREAVLIPVGGGKDSVVSLEVLRPHFQDRIRPMIINPRGATVNCCLQAGFEPEECALVRRNIDSQLLELNQQGYLNGHTPFSAMLAFTSLVSATLTSSRHIVLSNEGSANESTVSGSHVNHQYSKSLEFESDFRDYVARFISPDFNYFSFLRPLSELGIARLFSAFPLYHSIFRSCNAGSKTDSWCGKCPKCLFAFIILCPFLGIEKGSRIFGKNLLDDPSLEKYLNELCGISEVKPFECVGTRNEVNWALQQLEPYKEKNCLLAYYFNHPISLRLVSNQELESFSREHFLPEEFCGILQKKIAEVKSGQNSALDQSQAKAFLEFFQEKRQGGYIILVGMGREGQSSYRFIRQLLPYRKLILVDANPDICQNPVFMSDPHLEFITGQGYLDKMLPLAKGSDLIMKSPGVSFKDYPQLLGLPQLSSQTDLFLRVFGPQISGISGTKGKSTTTLLSYHLINAYRPCVLAGNMGIPVFDIIDEIGPKTHIICEFSAHQLEQARTAPAVGVLLNLFEEHLDHYSSFLDYQKAKMNLCPRDLSDKGHTFIFHQDDPLIRLRLRERNPEYDSGNKTTVTCRTFSLNNTSSTLHIENNCIVDERGNSVFDLSQPHPLIGSHNLLNLMAALLVAKANGIDYQLATQRINSFQPLPHRLQYVGCFHGKHFFNDSISTIPQATIAALESIRELPFVKGVGCLILGGLDRGIDYGILVEYFRQGMPENIIFVGQAGKRIFSLMQEAGIIPTGYFMEDNYSSIVHWAWNHTREGYACVLSPAAASYDQFKNFAHRGEVFINLVQTEKGQEEK